MKNAIGHQLDPQLMGSLGLSLHEESKIKDTATLKERLEHNGKLMCSLEDAIRAAGLRDGMTISFHHHFRDGDYVLNNVVETISRMGAHFHRRNAILRRRLPHGSGTKPRSLSFRTPFSCS